jgi:alpha-galactosidase
LEPEPAHGRKHARVRAPSRARFTRSIRTSSAITNAVAWDLVAQWLRLVSESGTALFVAIEPDVIEPKHRAALHRALEIAARPQPVGEPLDWMTTDCPRRWNLRGETVEFVWMGESGSWPFGD